MQLQTKLVLYGILYYHINPFVKSAFGYLMYALSSNNSLDYYLKNKGT